MVDPKSSADERRVARGIVGEWRACFGYPINTFQATVRDKLRKGYGRTLVAQRLKRLPTIIDKLKRYPGMNLVRMQDIGGLRAVVGNIRSVRKLERVYRDESRFKHELIKVYDYIDRPKEDGYRGVHLIYKYNNNQTSVSSSYNGLILELQLRTRLQHIWATAVETMGTYLGQALKSRQGDKKWIDFFAVTSSAFAHDEGTSPVPGYKKLSRQETIEAVKKASADLNVIEVIGAISVAGKVIHTNQKGKGWYYHLIILNSRDHTVSVNSYPKNQLAQASADYASAEERAAAGEPIEPVLVAAGKLDSLKHAYPNYFLDIRDFTTELQRIIKA